MKFNFNYLTSVLDSRLSVLEVLYVLNDLKNIARVSVKVNKKRFLINYCQKYNLSFEFADFAYLSKLDPNQKNFGHRYIPIPDNSSYGEIYVYISKSEDLVKQAALAEKNHDYRKFGELLGYPKCCIEFYVKNKNDLNDYVLLVENNSLNDSCSYYANYCLRCFNVALISHFPCSFDCEKSIEIGMKNEKFLFEYFPEIAKEFENILKSTVYYSSKEIVYSSNFIIEMGKIKLINAASSKSNEIRDYIFDLCKNVFIFE